jgi:hypothetical protein
MKKKLNIMKTYFKAAFALILLVVVSACDDRFDEINTNPNGVADVDPAHLFAAGARASFRSGISGAYDYRVGAQLAHFYVGIQNDRNIDKYDFDLTGGTYESPYNSEYKDKLKYYNEILELTGPGMEKENKFHYAVADVMAVLAYSILTDAFGSIPYFQGGFGNFGELSPVYDGQEVIYPDMLVRLSADIATFKTADGSLDLVGQDPIFNNKPDLWIRFANSLKLRLAMRMRFVAPNPANVAISECLGEALMTSNLHNATSENVDGENSSLFNPWYATFDFWNFRISDKVVTQLSSTNDPRLSIYATPKRDGTYEGLVNGLVDDIFGVEVNMEHSFPGDYFVNKGTDTYLMTAAEIAFLQAECALFGLGGSDANAHYRRGIELTMERVGVPQDDINAFLQTETATLSGMQEEQFEQICTQLWLALAPNFTEAYASMRRTGYPRIPKRDGVTTTLGQTNGELPSRIIYPLSEKLSNNTNVEAAISDMGGEDLLNTRLWWDVNR